MRVEHFGRATLYLGDCRDILPAIQPVSLVLTDPPYGTTNNKWDTRIPFDEMWAGIDHVATGNVVLTAHGVFTARLICSREDQYRYRIVWRKSKATNFLNAKRQPLRKHEDICVFYRKAGIYNPQMSAGAPYNKGVRKNQLTGSYGDFAPVEVKSDGERYPTDIIEGATAESEGPVIHPTQKPEWLMDYLIRTYSNSGDGVLDFAMGVGSTGIAALKAGRSFVGIEKNADFFNAACARLASYNQGERDDGAR